MESQNSWTRGSLFYSQWSKEYLRTNWRRQYIINLKNQLVTREVQCHNSRMALAWPKRKIQVISICLSLSSSRFPQILRKCFNKVNVLINYVRILLIMELKGIFSSPSIIPHLTIKLNGDPNRFVTIDITKDIDNMDILKRAICK